MRHPEPPSTEAGWYEEPKLADTYEPGRSGWRYWDGKRWTGDWAPNNPLQNPSYQSHKLAGGSVTAPSYPQGWYEDPQRPGSFRERFWNGTEWTDKSRPTRFYLFLALLFGFAFGFFALLIALILLGGGSDSNEAEPASEPPGVQQPANEQPENPAACPPGQERVLMDVAPGAEPCIPLDPADQPSPAAAETPDRSDSEPAVVEGPGSCVGRTFAGTVVANLENVPAGGALTAQSNLVIGVDCVTSAEFVWLEAGSSDAYYSAKNPAGSFCAMVQGSDGELTFTPDGQGGGTLSGTIHAYPNVASSDHFDGACPDVSQVGTYVLEGVSAEFTANLSEGTLTGTATFDHRQLPFTVDITATQTSG